LATRKATEEFFIAKGLSRQAVIERIKDGRIKGTVDEKSIMVEESEWPDALQIKPKVELTESDVERQKVLDQTELTKAEALKLEAEIKLAIVKGERDKPETLLKKEAELSAMEAALTLKEKEYNDKKILIDATEQALNLREVKIINASNEAQKQIASDRAKTAQEIRDAKDKLKLDLANLQIEQDNITKDIESKKTELTQITDAVENARKTILPITENIQKWINVAKKHAEQSYYVSTDKRYNKQVQQHHQSKSDALWNNKDALERIKKTLGGLLKGF